MTQTSAERGPDPQPETTPLRVVLAADHAGVEMKAAIVAHLEGAGHELEDLGPQSTESVDYPDFAHQLAARVHEGRADRGILVCGSGVGMAMSANRWAGVRAVNCTDAYTARMAREHNDAIVLASRRLAEERPEVLAALRPLMGAVDATAMQRMNLAVDRDVLHGLPLQRTRICGPTSWMSLVPVRAMLTSSSLRMISSICDTPSPPMAPRL